MKRARRKFGLINLPISMEGMYTKYGKDYFRRGCKRIKLVKLIHLGIVGHNDRLAKLFGVDKRC